MVNEPQNRATIDRIKTHEWLALFEKNNYPSNALINLDVMRHMSKEYGVDTETLKYDIMHRK